MQWVGKFGRKQISFRDYFMMRKNNGGSLWPICLLIKVRKLFLFGKSLISVSLCGNWIIWLLL